MLFFPQIVIPFFSLLIKDIYFLNEGCANRLPNGHVNFEVSRVGYWYRVSPFNRKPKQIIIQLPLDSGRAKLDWNLSVSVLLTEPGRQSGKSSFVDDGMFIETFLIFTISQWEKKSELFPSAQIHLNISTHRFIVLKDKVIQISVLEFLFEFHM